MPELEERSARSNTVLHVDGENGSIGKNEAQKSKKRDHLINMRGVIPLYFFRYYFVIIVGEDKRKETQDVLHERRKRTVFAANMLFFLFVIFPYVIILMLFLYFLKQSLGIDIFPNIHWPNLIRDLFG